MDQQQQELHKSILNVLARVANPRRHYGAERHQLPRHKLLVYALGRPPVDRHSLDHLVKFLDNQHYSSCGEVEVVGMTELELEAVRLLPSAHLGNHRSDADGGGDGSALEALRAFFARSDTKFTKVSLFECDFGQQEQATQLVAAFHPNRIVVDVAISDIANVHGVALGNSFAGLLQHMPQLQRLSCHDNDLRCAGFRALQPCLCNNQASSLQELDLARCNLETAGICLLADALGGKTPKFWLFTFYHFLRLYNVTFMVVTPSHRTSK